MLRIEFHSHTIYSKDSLTALEDLLEACQKKGIDRIVVTDHNTISGARQACQLDPLRVVIGEEIDTTDGEILAAYVQEEIPPWLNPVEAIARLRTQGAFISVSHPFDRYRHGHWEESNLINIVPLVDAIETFNARCIFSSFNRAAQEFAQKHRLAGTAGSDAHASFEIGKACMVLPDFHDAASLKKALQTVVYDASLSSPWVHFISRYATLRKKVGKRAAYS